MDPLAEVIPKPEIVQRKLLQNQEERRLLQKQLRVSYQAEAERRKTAKRPEAAGVAG